MQLGNHFHSGLLNNCTGILHGVFGGLSPYFMSWGFYLFYSLSRGFWDRLCFLWSSIFLCKSRGVWGSGSTKYEVNETKLPNWQDRWRSQSRHSHAQAAVCSWLNKSYAEAAWVSGKYNCPKERAPLSPCFMTHLLLFLSKGKLRSKAFKSICFNNPHHQSLF